MKPHLTCLNSGLLLILSAIAIHGECTQSEAWGGSRDTITVEKSTKIVKITCNSCFSCVDPEGNPVTCNTDCVKAVEPPPDGYITPTVIVYVWNPDTNHWDVQGASGSCQEYTTVNC